MRKPTDVLRGCSSLAAALCSFAFADAGYARAPDAPPEADPAPLAIDYLTIRGNEGGAAGGHAAIRFGADTFHFEHVNGLLRLGREDSQRFQYVYRTLQNRDIERSRVPVSAETHDLLRGVFERRALVQERQLAIEQELADDARLLGTLLAAQRGARGSLAGDPGFEVRGAGFFEAVPGPTAATDPGARGITALKDRIEALHGPEFLVRRRVEVERALEGLSGESLAVAGIELSADRYPVVPPSFARQTENWLAARLALECLAQPRALRAQALAPAAAEIALTAAERERLRSAAGALRDGMARLVASQREDWGFALLLGMARLAAFEASLASGRWVLLEAFPAESATISVTGARRDLLPALVGEAQADLATARNRFLAGEGFRELDWNALEAAAGRWGELRAAVAGAPEIRIRAGAMLPEGRAQVMALPRPSGDLELLLEQSHAAADRYHARLLELYGYDLLQRNCVSEIFRTLELALSEERAPAAPAALLAFVREESTRRLGGYVHPVREFNFIPFVSAWRVQEHWSVGEHSVLPSYRHFRLAEMAASEPPLLVALRESNVLTARTHRDTSEEGFFVFYTDTQVFTRPLFGILNLGAGLLRSALGLAALPLDGGRGLRSGLSGVVFSVPELVFQNIRKGYNDYVPPGERPPPG